MNIEAIAALDELLACDASEWAAPKEDLAAVRETLVRAVNSHEKLLEALKAVVDGYQEHFDIMPVAWQTFDDIARAAIAAAEGE